MKNLIPQSLSKQKGIFYKNIAWKDILIALVEIIISCGISFGLIFIDWWIRVIIALSIFLILSLLSFPYNKYNDCRLYKLWWFKIKFLITPKTYYNTKELNPYLEIKDGYLYTKKPKDGKSHYIAILDVKGLDLTALSNQEAKIKLDQFHSILINLKKHFSIAKINQGFKFNHQASYLKNKIQLTKNDYDNAIISQLTYDTSIKQLNNQLNILNNISSYLHTNSYDQHFYLFLYDVNLENLEKDAFNLKQDLENMNMIINQLDAYESVNVIKNIFNPAQDNISNETIDQNRLCLDDLFNFNSVKFKKDHLIINDQLLLDFCTISDYPLEIDYYWLAFVLLSTNANVMINAKQLNQNQAISLMNKAIVNSASNQFNEKKQVQKMQYETINNTFKQMSQEIIKQNQCVFNTNIILLNYDVEYKSLIKQRNQMEKVFNTKLIKLNRLKYRQFEGLNSFLPKINDSLMQIYGREIPSKSLANGYGFIQNILNDNNGLILAKDILNTPVIFDQFKLDQNRKNHNMLILGQSGSGKSYFTKKLINWNCMNQNHIFILDVENEYINLVKNYDGNCIDIGSGNHSHINPLQIHFLNKNDCLLNKIMDHLLLLETFFSILFKDLNQQQLRYLINIIKQYYLIHGYDHIDLDQIKNHHWPTFNNIYDFCLSNQNTIKDLYHIDDVLFIHELIRSEFINEGKLSHLYNHHTSINIDKKIVCFDLYSLFDKNNQRIIQAQLFLSLNYIENIIKNNNYDKNHVLIIIDEAHLLIDENNPIALDFIYQMVKRIRKRNGAIVLITQNPDDFLSNEKIIKKTKAILNNTQYSLFFNLSPNNINDISEIYQNYGSGLSEQEKLFIAKAKRGQALFFVGGFDRHQIDIYVNELEKEIF